MEINTFYFSTLTTQQLYEILALRAAVFVVEQNCIYQDIDGKDQKALHILGYKNGVLVAYTRIFKPGDYLEKASIGRVVVAPSFRKKAFGKQIMETSIAAVKTYFNTTTIEISAQTHLINFYTSLKFKTIGTPYLEDGIPHIKMQISR